MKGTLCCLGAAGEIQRDTGSLHSGKEELCFIEISNALVGTLSDKAYRAEVPSLQSFFIDKVVSSANPQLLLSLKHTDTLKLRRPWDAYGLRGSRYCYWSLSRIYPKPSTAYSTTTTPSSGITHRWPRAVWRPPRNAYWLGDSRCFKYTGSLVDAEPRAPESLSLGGHKNSSFETLRFSFKHDLQDPTWGETPSSNAFRAYRRRLLSQQQSSNVHLVIHPSKPHSFTLFVG